MKAVIQRVSEASVEIDGNIFSSINKGLLVLLGFEIGDSEKEVNYLSNKIIDLRIFPDENDKMNLSLNDIKGELLIISQFTLCTDDKKSGNRPSFTFAEKPEIAKVLYEKFIESCKIIYKSTLVKGGIFGAYMKVRLLNDGPVTIITERKFDEK